MFSFSSLVFMFYYYYNYSYGAATRSGSWPAAQENATFACLGLPLASLQLQVPASQLPRRLSSGIWVDRQGVDHLGFQDTLFWHDDLPPFFLDGPSSEVSEP